MFIRSCGNSVTCNASFFVTSVEAVDSGEATCGAVDNGVCSTRAMLKHPLSLHSPEEAVAGDADAFLQFSFL